MGEIYAIRNKINNKTYIGKTIDSKRRFKEHKFTLNNNTHSNIYLQNSWKKYGKENFEFFIIADDVDESIIDDIETSLIAIFNTFNKSTGYNLTVGGDGVNGYTHSDETRLKMKMNHTRKSGENHPFYNKKHTPEAINIISESMKGKGNGMFGKTHSEETKMKIREKMLSNKNGGKKKYEHLKGEVKKLYKEGLTQTRISQLLNIPQYVISKIINNKY